MRSVFLLITLIPIFLSGCRQSNMAVAVSNGVAEIDIAKDFEALFPDSEHFITYYTGTKGDPIWNSKVGLHGRYVLTVRFRIGFDESRTHPVREQDPVFHLVELANISKNGYGYTDRHFEFGLKEWNLLMESSGDFNVIGYPMKKDKPLDGFDTAWR
jgi:hypothetical protein